MKGTLSVGFVGVFDIKMKTYITKKYFLIMACIKNKIKRT